MITDRQIVAARALLEWSASVLSEKCGLSIVTIQRMEAAHGIPSSNVLNLLKVKTALEKAGVEFIAEGVPSMNGGAGVRFKTGFPK